MSLGLWTIHLESSLDIPPQDTKLFSLSRSVWSCYLEVSAEEGKLAKEWCDCVKCPDMVSVLLK